MSANLDDCLIHASKLGNVEVVKELASEVHELGSSVNCTDEEGQTPLHHACANGLDTLS